MSVSASAAPPPATAHHTCANGLEILVAENHATPLFTVEIAVHNGAMAESPDYNGLSHLYEHMFFKGNAAMPDQLAFMARIRALGMSFNGTTDTERVNYFFTTTSDHFADAMVFMRDAIVTPLFDAKELDRERVVVTGEIDRNESNPFYYLWHTVEQHVFWKYPSRKDALGSRATVLSATTAKLRTIQQRYYVPNNSMLVVTGDVQAAEVFQKVDQLYASWAHADDPFVKYPLVTHPPIPRSEVVLVPQPVENFAGMIMWQGPQTVGDSVNATYAADLLSGMVNDPGSAFQKTLVDSGLCVSAGLSYQTQRNVGGIVLNFEAVPARVDACASAVLAELPKMRAAGYFADAELRNAARGIQVHMAEARETTGGYAHSLTYFWTSATLDYYATYLDRVQAVTRDNLAQYLDGFILGKPFIFGAMASQKVIDGGLSKAHLEQVVGIAGGVR